MRAQPDEAGTQDDDVALKQVAARYAVSVTDAVLKTIRAPGDPVALQYLPQAAELVTLPEEIPDPIGDETHSPVRGIVHRYPDRVLLMPVQVCAVYCRFCFRREHVGPGQKMLKPAELRAALDYIRSDSRIWEVILSGGDPLILGADRLREIVQELNDIPHVQVIRIHSRIPVADPARITDEMCETLSGSGKQVYVLVHINHAQELSADAVAAFTKLQRAGCVLLSQSVLLKNVNDNPVALEDLFRSLAALGVKPYYLHHPDLAPGTSHFRMSLKEGLAIVRQLRGRVSGLCLPTYMIDIPGGYGKVPVDSCHVVENRDGSHSVTDPWGVSHRYT
ncbi:MAG TPA: lysine-2,3-aminomutase-like protein [Alphaproteobacteria bacterium]